MSNVLVTSAMKSFPMAPVGTLNRFFLHLTTSSYALSMVVWISSPLKSPHVAELILHSVLKAGSERGTVISSSLSTSIGSVEGLALFLYSVSAYESGDGESLQTEQNHLDFSSLVRITSCYSLMPAHLAWDHVKQSPSHPIESEMYSSFLHIEQSHISVVLWFTSISCVLSRSSPIFPVVVRGKSTKGSLSTNAAPFNSVAVWRATLSWRLV